MPPFFLIISHCMSKDRSLDGEKRSLGGTALKVRTSPDMERYSLASKDETSLYRPISITKV